MHLGNVFTALMSWLSVRSRGGRWILRIEDLDPQRSRVEYSRLIEDDLHWLGLDWDEGGLDGAGSCGPYMQSRRHGFYENALVALRATGLTYACTCTRADIMATRAPHQSDGRVVYGGRCRPAVLPAPFADPGRPYAERLAVPDSVIEYADRVFGVRRVNLARDCGDFVLRRADGAWAYQLAVVVDDALMGVTEVVRGVDLLESSAQQEYLYALLGYAPPRWAHLPLLCNREGRRLSKRDRAMDMAGLRASCTPSEIIGRLAWLGGLLPYCEPCAPSDLLTLFSWDKVPRKERIIV